MTRMLLVAAALPVLAEAGLFSMFEGAKNSMCGIFPVPLVCPSHGSGGGGGQGATNPTWCPGSSCKWPLISCRSDRGPTTCASNGMFSMGVCACTQQGAVCSSQGLCGPRSGSGGGGFGGGTFGRQRLFEEPEQTGEVIKEDVVTPFAVLGCLSTATLLGAVVLVRRIRGDRAVAGYSDALSGNIADEELLTEVTGQ